MNERMDARTNSRRTILGSGGHTPTSADERERVRVSLEDPRELQLLELLVIIHDVAPKFIALVLKYRIFVICYYYLLTRFEYLEGVILLASASAKFTIFKSSSTIENQLSNEDLTKSIRPQKQL